MKVRRIEQNGRKQRQFGSRLGNKAISNERLMELLSKSKKR